MGAVCYKPKHQTTTKLSKEEILKAITNHAGKDTVAESEMATKQKNFDSSNTQIQHSIAGNHSKVAPISFDSSQLQAQKQSQDVIFQVGNRQNKAIEINILSYFGTLETNYNTLSKLSKSSIKYLRKNHDEIQNFPKMKHENENFNMTCLKSIQEHHSGVNQMAIYDSKMLSISDDCQLKRWNPERMIVEDEIQTETITCFSISGIKKEFLFACCHSGNIQIINLSIFMKKETIEMAHQNLIRSIATLEALKNEYFVTADVCGGCKVWTSTIKPKEIISFELLDALAYNSIVEIKDRLPNKSDFKNQTLIACALKNCTISIHILDVGLKVQQKLQIISTQMKPTCLINLSNKHIICATGNLRQAPRVEIFHSANGKLIDTLEHHTDMIDFIKVMPLKSVYKIRDENTYIQYLLTAGRDRRIVIWKLFDGKRFKRHSQPIFILKNNLPQIQNDIGSESNWIAKSQKVEKIKNQPSDSEPSASEQEPTGINPVFKENAFYSMLTTHTDFIRSVIWLPEKQMLYTGSEDKTIQLFRVDFDLK